MKHVEKLSNTKYGKIADSCNGGSGEGLLPLRKNRPSVSLADHKKQQKGAQN